MNSKKTMIPLKELNLTNRFLFAAVMDDPQTHQDVLSIIFNREIPLLHKNETEKEFRKSPQKRSIRMDVYATDEDDTVYNTEMQAKKRNDLSKRSRYYQSLMDASLLPPGIPDYNRLNPSYIIMITTFDPFGYGRYCYTFEARCREEPDCVLGDGACRIFLNTRGTNDGEISQELADFLHYVEHTAEEAVSRSSSERLQRIHARVCEVRTNEEIGARYMQEWEERYYEKEEARKEGHAQGLEEGHAKGLEEGHEQGKAEGDAEGSARMLQQMAQRLSRMGVADEMIAQAAECPVENIRELLEDTNEGG